MKLNRMGKSKKDSLPLIGQKFPTIEVNTTKGRIKLPEYYQGNWFILFSHPGDFTPVCTTEFVEFALHDEDFKMLNAELIGLSVDQIEPHIKWIEWIEKKFGVPIPFPVIADSLGEVSKKLGMISPFKGSNTVRAVFIVDDKGIIRTILYYPQEIGRNINEIIRAVKALQVSEKQVATPANWPYNSIIGSKVLIPPPQTYDKAKQVLKSLSEYDKIECKDWWFCYKDLDN